MLAQTRKRQTFGDRKVVANRWEDGLGERVTTKGHERPLWGDSNVPHLDFDGDNMIAYLYQNS